VVSTDNSGEQGGKDGAQRENDVQADQPVADD
jgi:hypothetical protein